MQPIGAPRQLIASVHIGPEPGGGSGVQRYEVAGNDGLYCVKLQGNRQGLRVLFNDFVSSRFGELIGVPLGEPALVSVSAPLLPQNDPRIPNPVAGVQFGARRFDDGQPDIAALRAADNFRALCAVPVMDTFILRADSRQHLVYPSNGVVGSRRNAAAIFDHGFAFTGSPGWSEASLNAAPVCNVNDDLQMKQAFPQFAEYDPYIGILEGLTTEQITLLINEPPLAEWGVTQQEADALVRWLDNRKHQIRAAFQQYLI
jgi:hypothetical protein